MSEIMFYDVEVYTGWWCVCVSNNEGYKNQFTSEHNNINELKDIVDTHTMVGFNNYSYDDIILENIISGRDKVTYIKYLSDSVIIHKDKF